MTTFRHLLPFGAERMDGMGTRFRLWAPAARSVTLVADGRQVRLQAQAGGWYATKLGCPPGTRYHYLIDGRTAVPDPASRQQAGDVHDDSIVVDPCGYQWQHPDWTGRPWQQSVVMELHVGACGGFSGVVEQLPRLVALGITAIELMPIADFSGQRNWGYDGVLPFAPDAVYGTPEQLKALIDTAHGLGLCVYLDVVYNHFGPDGNYLHLYAPQFFDDGEPSPWGPAIDFKRREVRDFFSSNVLFWLQEYRFDGLRFDAVHAIDEPGWLDEMAALVRREVGPHRHVHLMLENERNAVGHLAGQFDAQWNDDGHNSLHALLTGESEGYYANYQPRPVEHLARCLAEGFAYQGEVPPTGGGKPRGEPSGSLPPTCFMLFLQNHDQIGNRAFGERLTTLVEETALRAAIVLQLLCPQIPLLFMGEEFGCRRPFLFFTDFHDELADAVRDGRRREFEAFSAFASADARERIPDPNALETFERSVPSFAEADDPGYGRRWSRLYSDLLWTRRERIVPLLDRCHSLGVDVLGDRQLVARWQLGEQVLVIALNLGEVDHPVTPCSGELLYESAEGAWSAIDQGSLPACSAVAFLQSPEAT